YLLVRRPRQGRRMGNRRLVFGISKVSERTTWPLPRDVQPQGSKSIGCAQDESPKLVSRPHPGAHVLVRGQTGLSPYGTCLLSICHARSVKACFGRRTGKPFQEASRKSRTPARRT